MKMLGLGPWWDSDTKWQALNGAPASYLSTGWHGGLPGLHFTQEMEGDLGPNFHQHVIEFLGYPHGSKSQSDTMVGQVSAPGPQKQYENPKTLFV